MSRSEWAVPSLFPVLFVHLPVVLLSSVDPFPREIPRHVLLVYRFHVWVLGLYVFVFLFGALNGSGLEQYIVEWTVGIV